MGLFDSLGQIAGSFLGGNNQSSPLLNIVLQMLNSQSGAGGGLGQLLQSFQQKGLGDIVSSWVSTGQNQPISADQIQQGFGSDIISQMASKLNLSSGDVSSQLSQILPNLVDKLTPQGQIPDNDALSQALSFLKGKLSE
ncbi:MAG: DUF937 domain-containing protein [Deltaproteobacteria bacterium]|nr:DUF937 domain-containing protein [Deltaproteobacteria bacterium]